MTEFLIPLPEPETPPQSCIHVAVPLPIEGTFSYSVPEHLKEKIQIGVRVRVPFRNRDLIGYLVGEEPPPPGTKLKPVLDILDEKPVLSKSVLDLTKWISETYASSWGEAIENAIPKWVKYGKKAERALKREKAKALPDELPPKQEDLTLTPDQAKAFESIQEAFNQSEPKPLLLFGVTGSGKSELYIRAIRHTLAQNKSAICLVPEIALTEQLKRFFHHHFGNDLEILHSKLSDGERFLAWKRLERCERRFILGPRSAIFAPTPNLGLIIMDEEHEGSYKQETTPRYHAREVALWRAQYEKAVMIMGSATPSLEIMHRAEQGEITRLDLPNRVDERPMPEVGVLDLKQIQNPKGRRALLTPKLSQEIQTNLSKKEGTLLLLNRRGFSTHIHCPECGIVESCTSCQVSLTFHQTEDILLCHYCNFQKPVPEVCSDCKAPVLRFAGFGTEKVESEVARQFPNARLGRMDADTVRNKGAHEKILKDFRAKKIDILIGTQMIAKGFDFPHVTLVGVILADVGLALPDFRSAERTFQLLTQVAGRAGRGKLPGRVLIQTFSPNHPSVRCAKTHDYSKFYAHEILERKELGYPPYGQLLNLIIRSKDEMAAYSFAREARDTLMTHLPAQVPEIDVIGPAPLPFYRLRGHFRWHVMLKAPSLEGASKATSQVLAKLRKPARVAMALDVDPLNIL